METTKEPKLAPPGAGIPLSQLILARLYLGPFVSKKSTWADSRRCTILRRPQCSIASRNSSRPYIQEEAACHFIVAPL